MITLLNGILGRILQTNDYRLGIRFMFWIDYIAARKQMVDYYVEEGDAARVFFV